MPAAPLPSLNLADLEAVLGPVFVHRGRDYAERGKVRTFDWDSEGGILGGVVSGQGQAMYLTEAAFVTLGVGAALRPENWQFVGGSCTCPMQRDCKHVAAVVLAAHRAPLAEALGRPSDPLHRASSGGWQRALDDLLGPSDPFPHGATIPLGVQLAVTRQTMRSTVSDRPSLTARLVRPGQRGWKNDNLTWDRLDVHSVRDGMLDASQVDALRTLHALTNRRGSYAWSYGGLDREVDLTMVDTPHLWGLLDDVVATGVALVTSDSIRVSLDHTASVHFDVTGMDSDAAVVTPTVVVEGHRGEVRVLTSLGTPAHGIAWTSDPDSGTAELRLARLGQPVTPSVLHAVTTRERLTIPALQQTAFKTTGWPRLRRAAPVVSSDGTFLPPTVQGPTLLFEVIFGQGADVGIDLAGRWGYQVDGEQLDHPLPAPVASTGLRDATAEATVLRDVQTALGAAEPGSAALADLLHELRGDASTPYATGSVGAAIRVGGITGMQVFASLRDLTDRVDAVQVEVHGTVPDYRLVEPVIAVSTAAVDDDADWFDLGIELTVGDTTVAFVDLFEALSGGEDHLLLDDGAYVALDSPELIDLRRLIDEARLLQDAPGNSLRLSRFQADLWAELAALGIITAQAEEWREQVEALAGITRIDPVSPPSGLAATLRPYQQEGFEWLRFLWHHGLGGILADDMGLGKTVQALALIGHARDAEPDAPPFLVLAPASVVGNWAAEAARFMPGLDVQVVPSTLRTAGLDIDDVVRDADVVITSYTCFRLDHDRYGAQRWAGLMMDEAQAAKNHRSKLYGCLRRVRTPFKLAITGTPMENNLMELWTLLSLTAPGLFADPTVFKDLYARPIERHHDDEKLAQLRRRIRPLVTRRTKGEVLSDLPAKQEQVLEVPLHTAHRAIYDTRLQRERQRVLGLVEDLDQNRFTILRSLTLLRQLCLHPALVDDNDVGVRCAKLDVLVEHLREAVEGGHRSLVFSQFTGFLTLVRDRLDAEGIDFAYLDGSTRNRDRVISAFKEGDAPVFLISLKAGGVGLNLTEADYCFLLDPWWNPATETQAVDRTHRIGQTNPVLVYRLIASNTIEQKVLALNRRKATLFDGVMDEGQVFSGSLSAQDIHELFG